MRGPMREIVSVETASGPLSLRQRGESEFLLTIAGRVLMSSVERRSEEALASLCLPLLSSVGSPQVLIGGLGMAFTLRAALDLLPLSARVVVAELTPEVALWCKGPLAQLTGGAVVDPRVQVEIGDVSKVIARAPKASYDAILLDLYEGPHAATQGNGDPFYGSAALSRTKNALRPGGVFGVWSEAPDERFERRFAGSGFVVKLHRIRKGGRTHVVYVGQLSTGPGKKVTG